MRQIDNMTPQELDVLALKGMTAPRTASERMTHVNTGKPAGIRETQNEQDNREERQADNARRAYEAAQ